MKIYSLPRCQTEDILSQISAEDKSISLSKEFIDFSKRLEYTKSKLDKYYQDDTTSNSFDRVLRLFDHFKDVKRDIETQYGAEHVTNAWIKFWEIVSRFKLVPKKINEFNLFCNACLPGSDILAINHYVNTKTSIKKFSWKASSLIDTTEEINPLTDSYGLYKTYPQNWIVDEKNNGDVTSVYNQLDIKSKIGGSIDLYTSDLGFDVSNDYNGQEKSHAKYNLGQILSGLVSLKRGGCMVVKLYTFFTPFTISLLTIVSSMFDKMYITKPSSSKGANSETYIVCLGFTELHSDIYTYLLSRLSNFSLSPLLDSSRIKNWDKFMSSFSLAKSIFNEQITYINNAISIFEQSKIKNMNLKREVDHITDRSGILREWFFLYSLKRMNKKFKLSC